jgi:hypothetical protein
VPTDLGVTGYAITPLLLAVVERLTAPGHVMARQIKGQTLVVPVRALALGRIEPERPVAEDVARIQNWQDSAYVRQRVAAGHRIEDKLVYELRGVTAAEDGAKMTAGLTTYGSCLAAQDALEAELCSALAGAGDADAAVGRLKLRQASVGQNGMVRAGNALAIAVTLVVPDEVGQMRLLFGPRSSRTGAHGGMFHVMPAGMVQPELGGVQDEWDLEHAFLKEYGEELFGMTLEKKPDNPRYFYDAWPAVRALRAAIADGRCEFRTTGLVLSLFNLRPEVTAVLLVRDRQWWREQERAMKPNWEYDEVLSIGLERVEDEFVELCGTDAGRWVSSGLASFWLAADWARADAD